MTDDPRQHRPDCERPGDAHERGYSVTVTRCLGCGCVSTTRNTPTRTEGEHHMSRRTDTSWPTHKGKARRRKTQRLIKGWHHATGEQVKPHACT